MGDYVGYVYYPTISTDMLQRVADGTTAHNNQAAVAKSATLSSAKLIYYKIFAWIFCKAGRCSEVTMINTSWTKGHILQVWQMPGSTYKVYPPCDVEEFTKLARHDDEDQEKKTINLFTETIDWVTHSDLLGRHSTITAVKTYFLTNS